MPDRSKIRFDVRIALAQFCHGVATIHSPALPVAAPEQYAAQVEVHSQKAQYLSQH
jgi:hypothetical protein